MSQQMMPDENRMDRFIGLLLLRDRDGPTPLREIFIAWEVLRLVYLVVISIWTLLLMLLLSPEWLLTATFMGEAVFGFCLVNVAYFAGPLLEAYINWLGFRHAALRIGLWVIGTGFTAIVAAYSVLTLFVNWLPFQM